MLTASYQEKRQMSRDFKKQCCKLEHGTHQSQALTLPKGLGARERVISLKCRHFKELAGTSLQRQQIYIAKGKRKEL